MIKIYQIDAFANKIFSGNPAAVCPLETWLSDDIMLKIAAENNLAETAFYVKDGDSYQIRWFTPTVEVDLCGHATLASAYVLFQHENYVGDTIRFFSPRSGELTVSKQGDFLALNFPVDQLSSIELTNEIIDCFDQKPSFAFKGKTDLMLVFDNEMQIQNLIPNFEKINKLGGRGVIVTAKGNQTDFVSRFFAPAAGINEDPVTGSAHTTLIPYWAKQTGKSELTAFQVSKRGGYLACKLLGDRVEISGQAKLYLEGKIQIE
jgi:PhzF family phenazine biosynthesis protein